MEPLTQTTITFGQHNGKDLAVVLKDRSYCRWLLKQDWFKNDYEYLYNRIAEYNPLDYFIKKRPEGAECFEEKYDYFNLCPICDLEIELTEEEKMCYTYYLDTIDDLKARIALRVEKGEANVYDIKAPVRWLQKFESRCGISRDKFKEFIKSYDLPNVTSIVEDIKGAGGIEYKGAKSFLIAKERSLQQEAYWENILKEAYGEDLGTQFKYNDCVFDFLCIPTETIFECKLGLKDFDQEQYRRYRMALEKYRIVYLISTDAIVHIAGGTIYTTAIGDYEIYQQEIPNMKNPSAFDKVIQDYKVVHVEDLRTLFGYSKSVTHE